jgi:CheY-like chemotaxis protein
MERIRLVEYHEINRALLSRRLERCGYPVVKTLDGAQGVAMIKSRGPSLILMDLSQPVVDRWLAKRAVESDAAPRSICAFGQTTAAITNDRTRCREAGCCGYSPTSVEFPCPAYNFTEVLTGSIIP